MKLAKTQLAGKRKVITITPGQPTSIIGERCNALGYKIVRESVENGNYDVITERAIAQVAAGADIVNVNMVGMKIPEEEALPKAVERIASVIDVPLSLDFGELNALEAALKITPGRCLINSVNGEAKKLDPTLELAKKYNAALIALPCGEEGIPPTAEGRLRCAHKIIERAATFGIPLDDLIFDGICIAVATDVTAGQTTFETCRLLRQEFGVNITLGASNSSFGAPKRRTLDAFYLAMGIMAGMNVPLTDATLPTLKWAILSSDVCLGYDEFGARYIRAFRTEEKEKANKLQEQLVKT